MVNKLKCVVINKTQSDTRKETKRNATLSFNLIRENASLCSTEYYLMNNYYPCLLFKILY